MNRRGFLGILSAVIAGATLDPERLLWEPGKKLISIPSPSFDEASIRAYIEMCHRQAVIQFGHYLEQMLLNDRYWRGEFPRNFHMEGGQ